MITNDHFSTQLLWCLIKYWSLIGQQFPNSRPLTNQGNLQFKLSSRFIIIIVLFKIVQFTEHSDRGLQLKTTPVLVQHVAYLGQYANLDYGLWTWTNRLLFEIHTFIIYNMRVMIIENENRMCLIEYFALK